MPKVRAEETRAETAVAADPTADLHKVQVGEAVAVEAGHQTLVEPHRGPLAVVKQEEEDQVPDLAREELLIRFKVQAEEILAAVALAVQPDATAAGETPEVKAEVTQAVDRRVETPAAAVRLEETPAPDAATVVQRVETVEAPLDATAVAPPEAAVQLDAMVEAPRVATVDPETTEASDEGLAQAGLVEVEKPNSTELAWMAVSVAHDKKTSKVDRVEPSTDHRTMSKIDQLGSSAHRFLDKRTQA